MTQALGEPLGELRSVAMSKDMGASASAETGSQATPEAASASSPNGIDPARYWSDVRGGKPETPVSDTAVEVDVVGRRCVYVNNYRIAGGKPYVSEGLPSHTLNTSLGEVLDAFTEKEIRAALREKKAVRDHYARAHAALAAAARQSGDVQQAPGEAPQSGGETATPKGDA